MTIWMWDIFELAINAFQSCLFTFFLWQCLKIKQKPRLTQFGYVLCVLSLLGALELFNYLTYFEGVAIFVYILILLAFAIFCFEDDILKKLIVAVLPLNASAIGSILSTNIVSQIFTQNSVFLLAEDSWFRVLTVLVSNAILCILLWILGKIFQQKDVQFNRSEYGFMLALLCISIITFMFLFWSIFNSSSQKVNLYITLAIVGLVVITLTTYYLLMKFSRKHQLEMENTFLKQQQMYYMRSLDNMKEKYDAVQKIKHDYKNALCVIQGLNTEGRYDEITQYISAYLETSRNTSIIVKTNCIYVDILLTAKIAEATESNIDVKLVTTFNLPADEYIDFCNLLGNLFDNAIAACRKVDADRIIRLDIIQNDNEIVVCMKNSISSSVLEHNPELLSEKADGDNHGYGTKIIRDIAKKYHGFADFYEEEGLFCCNVVLQSGCMSNAEKAGKIAL